MSTAVLAQYHHLTTIPLRKPIHDYHPEPGITKKLLIIIPCFNEAGSIGQLLSDLNSVILPGGYLADIAVVNDCSIDGTAAIAGHHNAVLLDLPVNLGIGGAMQTGFLFARQRGYDLAVQMDGDGQHPPGELHKLLNEYSKTSANVIIGSRFLIKQGYRSSLIRQKGIAYFHWLNKILTGRHIYDSTSGFRLFDKKAIDIAANKYPDEYPEPESLVIFAGLGLQIREVPVVMRERQGGVSSIKNFTSLYYCFKVTIAMIFSFIRK
jgi:glycosyltransferase involved in cell wall biosynthesis